MIYRAALTCTENKPPQGDLKSSDRLHPAQKCTLKESQCVALKIPSVFVPVPQVFEGPHSNAMGQRGDYNTLRPCQLL